MSYTHMSCLYILELYNKWITDEAVAAHGVTGDSMATVMGTVTGTAGEEALGDYGPK